MPDEVEDSPGRRVIRRFDDAGRLLQTLEFNILPDGKHHDRELDATGDLVREAHSYLAAKGPLLTIYIERIYQAGRLTDETYIVKGRLVSRKSYDKARANYPSMPAPDPSIEDTNADLVRAANSEHRVRYLRYSDPERGRAQDEFCRKLIAEGHSADATIWTKERAHTLGGMDSAASRRLVARLMKAGALAVTACKIGGIGDAQGNSRHIVVELPSDELTRRKALRVVERLARKREDGVEPTDDGQRYCYVKLD